MCSDKQYRSYLYEIRTPVTYDEYIYVCILQYKNESLSLREIRKKKKKSIN